MKPKYLLVFMTVFFSLSLFSQSYYYGDKTVENIFLDKHRKLIHFPSKEAYVQFEEKLPLSIQIIKKLSKYNALVIESRAVLPKDIRGIKGLEQIEIAHQTPVFTLHDGFQLWLSYELLFEPKLGFESEIRNLASQYSSEINKDSYGMWTARVSDPMLTIEMANELMEMGYVEYAHPNFYANHSKQEDPFYSQQFQLNNTGQFANGVSGLNDIDCNAPEAWEITTGHSNLIVAVIDDGVEEHEDITNSNGSTRLLPGYSPLNDGDGSPLDNDSHGMACTGIIAASHNDLGIKGIAPNVQIIPINVFLGSETVADLARAFNYARLHGSDVISNSWNFNSCSYSLAALNRSIRSATINGRNGKGSVVVFSAGNGYGSCVDYPADLPYVIGVGAVTNLGAHSNYSNQGLSLDLVAPSSAAFGQTGANVSTIDRPGSAGYSSGNYTNTFGGTSAACPVVAGVAALVLSVNPDLSESEVREILNLSATDMGPTGFDVTYGHGRVNAYAALLMALPEEEDCVHVSPENPFTESFEGNVESWTQLTSDQLDWTQISGSTPSINTGASQAFEGSKYLYIESSYPNFGNKSAVIVSPCFDISELEFPELSIATHLYGSTIGVLKVEASVDDENWTTLVTLSGNQGNLWNEVTIDLNDFFGEAHIRFRIVGQSGTNYTGDMCIDYFSIHESTSHDCVDISNNTYSENFETIENTWNQVLDDDTDWIRNSGETPTASTGPNDASEGEYYMFIEASSPNYPSKKAILESNCIDLSSSAEASLKFNYHMYGSHMGSLRVRAKIENQAWYTVWSIQGNQGNQWHEASIELSNLIGESNITLQIMGVTGLGYNSDIAIDNIEILSMVGTMEEESNEIPNIDFTAKTFDEEPRHLEIYPNPTTDLITIQIPQEKSIQISVKNLAGLILKEFSGYSSIVHISLGDLPKGIYLVDIRTENELIGIRKIAKTH